MICVAPSTWNCLGTAERFYLLLTGGSGAARTLGLPDTMDLSPGGGEP